MQVSPVGNRTVHSGLESSEIVSYHSLIVDYCLASLRIKYMYPVVVCPVILQPRFS